MSHSEHFFPEKFRCHSCTTVSGFELLGESFISKLEKERICPRCHSSENLELLFSRECCRCAQTYLVNEDQKDALVYQCEACIAEEEKVRKEEEEKEKKRLEEADRLRQEELKRFAEEQAKFEQEEFFAKKKAEQRKIEEEQRIRQEETHLKEETAAKLKALREKEMVDAMKVQPKENSTNKSSKQEVQPELSPELSKVLKKKSESREYIEAFFTALLIALFLRAFVVDAFKIPSKSMVPNLLVGDHLFVNKFIYGIRLPFTKTWLTHFNTPKRGEVVVFSWPKDESLDFIKRVVGLPGDKITVDKRELYVNDEKVNLYPIQIEGVDPENAQKLKVTSIEGPTQDKKFSQLPFMVEWKEYDYFVEDLKGVPHQTQYMKPLLAHSKREWIVPEGHLFAMGDNRDNSSDSREWGFVPMENLRGRALFIWFSWDSESISSPWYAIQDWPKKIRWNRFGKAIE